MSLAPRGLPGWSGWNWYARPNGYSPTISVIERPSESYADYHERKQREEGARRVPFGFSRALEDDTE